MYWFKRFLQIFPLACVLSRFNVWLVVKRELLSSWILDWFSTPMSSAWCDLLVRQKPWLVFLLFIRNFECSDRGGDVIKARHPLEPSTSRKSPLLSCSTPRSLFAWIIFCVSGTPYTRCCRWMCFPCSVLISREIWISDTFVVLGTGSGAMDPHYPTGPNMSYKRSLGVTEYRSFRNCRGPYSLKGCFFLKASGRPWYN